MRDPPRRVARSPRHKGTCSLGSAACPHGLCHRWLRPMECRCYAAVIASTCSRVFFSVSTVSMSSRLRVMAGAVKVSKRAVGELGPQLRRRERLLWAAAVLLVRPLHEHPAVLQLDLDDAQHLVEAPGLDFGVEGGLDERHHALHGHAVAMDPLVLSDGSRHRGPLSDLAVELAAGTLPGKSGQVVEVVLFRGSWPRDDVPALLGASERAARRGVPALLDRGVLSSASTRAPLFLTLPATQSRSTCRGRWGVNLEDSTPGVEFSRS